MESKKYTNCFLVRDNKICLAMKKRGFGVGLWNGSGGKIYEGESPEMTNKREVSEELGVDLIDFEKVGEITWFLKKEEKTVICYVFLATKWIGQPKETEEMKPEWFDLEKIPYSKMWDSDILWLPLIVSGKKIKALFSYIKEGGKLVDQDILEVKSF